MLKQKKAPELGADMTWSDRKMFYAEGGSGFVRKRIK